MKINQKDLYDEIKEKMSLKDIDAKALSHLININHSSWSKLSKTKKLNIITLNIDRDKTLVVINEGTSVDDVFTQAVLRLRDINYVLQDVWGFKQDSTRHKDWELPFCECAKMDNRDNYGTGVQSINLECPVHKILK